MRVCVVGRDFPPTLGGLADCTYWLCDCLASKVEVHVIAQTQDREESVPSGRFAVHGFSSWDWRGTLRFAALLRKIRPDVLIVNLQLYMFGRRGICFYLIAWITLWKWISRQVLLMNYIELYAAPATWKHRPVSWLQKWQARWLAHRADRVVTADARNAAELRTWLGPAAGVELIPVGGNIPPVAEGSAPIRKRREASLGGASYLVGTFSHLRHPEALAEAVRLLKERGMKLRFLTIGDAVRLHANDYSTLQAAARERGVADRFQETGYLRPDEVSRHLQTLDLYLYLDHCISTKSGTIMAALEHGLPVLAFHPRLEDEPFRHTENVFIVTELTGRALADGIQAVLTDSTLREKLASNGKSLYRREFDWPVIGDRFMKLLS